MSKTFLARHWATLLGLLAIMMWSTTISLTRSVAMDLGPLTACLSIFTTTALLGGLARLLAKTKTKASMNSAAIYLIVCGLFFSVHHVLLFLAVALSRHNEQVLQVTVLNYLWPFFTLLFSIFLLKKAAKLAQLLLSTVLVLLGLSLVLAGSANLSWHQLGQNLDGKTSAYVLAFLAALCWALYSVLTAKWLGRQQGSPVFLYFPVVALMFFMLPGRELEQSVWSWPVMMEILLLGGITYGGCWCWDQAMAHGQVTLLGAVSYFIPVLSVFVSSLYLQLGVSGIVYVGCIIMVVGSLLSARAFKTMPSHHCPAADANRELNPQ